MSAIHMNESMFEILTSTSMRWGSQWEAKSDRFEVHAKHHTELPGFQWKMAYWVGENAASTVLARSWLIDQGHDFELVWDMAEHPNGEYLGWVLLTDYETESWKEINTRETA